MNAELAKLLDRALGDLAARVLGACDTVRNLLRPLRAVRRVDHVLVVKFWGLGNWALLRPVVRDLRARYPGARFTVATLASNAELVRDLADDLILVRTVRLGQVLADLARGVARLRRGPPDLVVDFEQFSRSGALLARLGGGAQRIGFQATRGARDRLYTVRVPLRLDVHTSRAFRDLAEAAGVPPGPYVPGDLVVTAPGRREAARWIPTGRRYVVLHPGSGDNFPGRRWSEAGFAAVGRAAVATGVAVVVTGGGAEQALAARVAARIGGAAVSVAGRVSLGGLVALLDGAEALVANDTGPVHLASALGLPTLALFGPNTPVLYAPLAPRSRAFYRGLPCSPCLTVSNYRSSRCRIHTCMAAIPTGAVTQALTALLQEGPAPRRRAAQGAGGET